MGGYLSGLKETDPIPEVIEGIRARDGHVLSPNDGKIDQLEGAAYAAAAGYSKFAVNSCRCGIGRKAERAREMWPESG